MYEGFHATVNKQCSNKKAFLSHPKRFYNNKVLREHFERSCFTDNDKEIIESLIPNLKYILLKRRNLKEVAVSNFLAEKTNIWQISDIPFDGGTTREIYSNINVPIDDSALLNFYNRALDRNYCWDNYLEGSSFLEIFYEDLFSNTSYVIENILDYLELKPKINVKYAIENCPCKKVADEKNKFFMNRLIFLLTNNLTLL